MTVSIDNLAGEIVLAIKDYTEDVAAAIEKEVHETAQAVLQDVATSTAYSDQTGKYRKGWRCTKERSGTGIRYIIHNTVRGWLVHLLEFGHAKRGGGRVGERKHLRPAYDAHVPGMEERIKEIVRKGG